MTKYEYKKFQIKIGKTRRYRSTNTAAFKMAIFKRGNGESGNGEYRVVSGNL